MKHAIEHWRLQFRGEARAKDDKDITQADIDAHNLILSSPKRTGVLIILTYCYVVTTNHGPHSNLKR